MEEHKLKSATPTEAQANKPAEISYQVKDEDWKYAIEIILGINKHAEITRNTASELIVAARQFRKIIDFFTKLFKGGLQRKKRICL